METSRINRANMKCPECGRTVNTFDVVCPECGTQIDDTEIEELDDPEADFSDSFEEEYQNMYREDYMSEEEEDDVRSFRNLHTKEEFARFDELIAQLRTACKELEIKHKIFKRLYAIRENIHNKDVESCFLAVPIVIEDLMPFAGTLYEKSRKRIRGVCWIRHIANLLNRGVPTEWQEEWDKDYFQKVLSWLSLEESIKEELTELFETW